MKYPEFPPQAFIDDYVTRTGKAVPTVGWRDLPEWPIWASGYNAAVKEANQTILAKYDLTAEPAKPGSPLSKAQAIEHMKKGGQVFRVAGNKQDKFYYKIIDGGLWCRCNELGSWGLTSFTLLRDTDVLHVAEYDYENPELVKKPLPLPSPA